MKIALAQINPTVGAIRENGEKIIRVIAEAERQGAALAVFPEMALVGYPPRDLLDKKAIIDCNLQMLEVVARATTYTSAVVGFIARNTGKEGKPLHNAAALLVGGQVVSIHFKTLLPTYDVFDESRYFEPSPVLEPAVVQGVRTAVTVCEDAWNDKAFWKRRLYHSDPVERLAFQGARLLLNISASPYSMGKPELRRDMLSEIAKKYGIPVLFVNQVGGNDDLVFDGASMALSPAGEVVARARDFEEDLIFFDTETLRGDLHEVSGSDVEAVLKALVLGTRDYACKCGFRKVILGLSGGIDSAMVAVIAARAVGAENVTALAMPSPYTAASSLEDAEAVAKNLGIGFKVIPIHALFQVFREALSKEFRGLPEDAAEQNLQARIRSTLLMALSNKFGCLLLSTGNKSELAVGYCTLYGDMSGGLAVISDVPKTLVYRLADFVNRRAMIIPERILKKAPSAELKPNQTDQDDLPPYPVLDGILKAYVEDNLDVEEIIRLGYDEAVVREIVRKVDSNEYKRYQAAPGLKVSTRAFGPGRRFPIARGTPS
jgi:NAD+ synthetase